MNNNIDDSEETSTTSGLIELLKNAIKTNSTVKILRVAGPKELRIAVIALLDPTIQVSLSNHVIELLQNENIPSIEILLANPYSIPFLRKLDREYKCNWEIWRVQQQIMQFAEGLLYIAEKRFHNQNGPLRIGFHSTDVIWNIGILGNELVMLRTYGQEGKESGHSKFVEELKLKKESKHFLCNSFINYFESVAEHKDTNWFTDRKQFADFREEQSWPSIFKGNALYFPPKYVDNSDDCTTMGNIVAKICLQARSSASEQTWLSYKTYVSHDLKFFQVPSLLGFAECKWRGKPLKTEMITGSSLFNVVTALHKIAQEHPQIYSRKAAFIIGIVVKNCLSALHEFRKIAFQVNKGHYTEKYPYGTNLTKAINEIKNFIPTLSASNFELIDCEARELGKTLEQNARIFFRDAHLKNRVLRHSSESNESFAFSILSMNVSEIEGIFEKNIYDVDFESAYQKVTEWDDIIHILFFANTGNISFCDDLTNTELGKQIINILEYWTDKRLTEIDRDIFWKTVLARSLREYCRRLWYARVMPNTYLERYSLEDRDYYLRFATLAEKQLGKFMFIGEFLKICKKFENSLWKGISITEHCKTVIPLHPGDSNKVRTESTKKILLLGKDSEVGLERLLQLQQRALLLGYNAILIKEQPDITGESIMRKVLRYALNVDFCIIENTFASGHLYEFAHIAKMAESTVAIVQEENQGATWMFEDTYFLHNHWKKFTYKENNPGEILSHVIQWAESFNRSFAEQQCNKLPWMREHLIADNTSTK